MNLVYLSLGWIVLGVALMVALRVAFRLSMIRRNDLIHALLSVSSLVMIILGIAGLIVATTAGLAIVLAPLLTVALLLAVHRYRRSERQSLGDLLVLAADSGVPLDLLAESLAAERANEMGFRAARLARLLKQGIPLPNALQKSRLALPHQEHLALMAGAEVGDVGRAHREIARDDAEVSELYLATLNRVIYFLALLLILAFSWVFIARITREFSLMFDEFDLELPGLFHALTGVMEFSVMHGRWLLLACQAAIGLIGGMGLMLLAYRVGLLRQDLPFVFYVRRRWHTARLLRALGHGCRCRVPLPTMLTYIYRHDVEQSVANRIRRALAAIESGSRWTDSLLKQGLISGADRAVLNSAERAGNLPWALDELAESNLRQLAHRVRVRMMIVTPILYLVMAGLVAFTVIALFWPLVTVIEALS